MRMPSFSKGYIPWLQEDATSQTFKCRLVLRDADSDKNRTEK